MKFAEVAVDAPGGHRHAFTYSVPGSLSILRGQGVLVPFGARVVRGIVLSLSDSTAVQDTRDIIEPISPPVIISPERIDLALWIADYYLSPVFDAIALMLPPGSGTGKPQKAKYIKYVALNTAAGQADGRGKTGTAGGAKQAEVLKLLEVTGGRLPVSRVLSRVKCGGSVIKALLLKKLIILEDEEVFRDPLARRDFALEFPLQFTAGQKDAWQPVETAIKGGSDYHGPGAFLINGVTGSGKTEIYLAALAETIRQGKRGICLVPEIALTQQITDRFFARFPGRVAVIHSKLSAGEQYDEWRRISRGEFDIVIGPRSAIFAPQPDLGLIIVDEEHEWAYKQSDKMPRYHARDVAIHLAALSGAVLVLGTATPDVVTYYRALQGQYRLIELNERVSAQGNLPLPEVSVVNMGDEFKAGNRSIFSRLLKKQVVLSLGRDEQVMLYINRRGLATFIECGNCGWVFSCRKCSGTLTYHAASKRLICHHCRRTYAAAAKCPACASVDIKYLGIGTQTVEAECRRLFEKARILRFDSDAAATSKAYSKLIDMFRKREADIMIGTQMLAKGLDFPGVSLVGVINADTGLNLPDFRSAERTFQLLCQVAGRAGRAHVPGRAVIQTFNPGYYAIKCAARHDYPGFYKQEIKYRAAFGYPPYNNIVRLTVSHRSQESCKRQARSMANTLKQQIAIQGLPGLRLIGPAPAHLSRLRGKYQMQIIVVGQQLQGLLKGINYPAGWIVDVDPVGML
ncbi:MAG: primosomal protein N' [Chloroflexi bacterium]|nr:primosomal protein N' [Chloroflexota bacterium]